VTSTTSPPPSHRPAARPTSPCWSRRQSLSGWKITTIGDDIAWIKPRKDKDGVTRLYAINPEAGFFGVAPGTNDKTNFNAMASLAENTIFTNVALTDDGDVWWEGMGPAPAARHRLAGQRLDAGNRQGEGHQGSAPELPLHSARLAVPVHRRPVAEHRRRADLGLPVRWPSRLDRAAGLPDLDWEHGVYAAATLGSETTAAAFGQQGVVRRDPFAMLPFCGYNMADYYSHWLKMGSVADKPVPIFMVNWFRMNEKGQFAWPGFGDNARVLKWIIERCEGKASGHETTLGWMPNYEDIDWSGTDFSKEEFANVTSLDKQAWLSELEGVKDWFGKMGDKLPPSWRHPRQVREGIPGRLTRARPIRHPGRGRLRAAFFLPSITAVATLFASPPTSPESCRPFPPAALPTLPLSTSWS
jgi:phosphoenolpyruvate carboxykinase (GTP)